VAIRALIVDDEPLARQGIRDLLADEPDVEVAGECGNGAEAVAAVERERPDLLFLDIQLPELDGFGVLRAVGVARAPAVVFVTAFDAHALHAFHVHAVDYLLKPVERDRFRVALRRARALLHAAPGDEARGQLDARLAALLDAVGRAPRAERRLLVRADGRAFFLAAPDIDRIEAEGNYARIRARGRSVLVRESLGELERQLDPDRFFRIHRSTIVNADRVREIQTMFKGEHVVITTDGARLSLTRKYRELLEQRLGKRL